MLGKIIRLGNKYETCAFCLSSVVKAYYNNTKQIRGKPTLIRVIFGETGTGKTKRILDLANKLAKEAKGSVVFIDSDNSYMYDLATSVRFINATEYGIVTPKMLYGFLCGVAAMDFDLEYLFIDGYVGIANHPIDTLEQHFEELGEFCNRRGLNMIISVNGSKDDLPKYLQDMALLDT